MAVDKTSKGTWQVLLFFIFKIPMIGLGSMVVYIYGVCTNLCTALLWIEFLLYVDGVLWAHILVIFYTNFLKSVCLNNVLIMLRNM